MNIVETKAKELAQKLSFSKTVISDLDAQIKELQKRKKALDSDLNSFKNDLREAMSESGITRIESDDIKFRLDPPSKQVVIDDENLLPDSCFVASRAVSKELVKALIKTGDVIEGARIVDGKHRLVITGA